MKLFKAFGTFFLPLAGLLLASCNDSMELNRSVEQFQAALSVDNEAAVHLEDVAALYGGFGDITRSEMDIDCICDEANDTLLYVYNKPEGGWVIYSSDARVPPIIAESESGSFPELMKNENAKCWVESLASDLKMIKAADDNELNFSASEINSNKSFWRHEDLETISSIDGIDGGNCASTNGIKDLPPIQPDPEPKGHYEYYGTSYFKETYDSIPRMTSTNWNQEEPYNIYCPYQKGSTTTRAPAGCAAIAVGQMLYFLHNKYGIPKTAPSKAYCYGNVEAKNFNYNWAQTDYTEEIWDEMSSNDSAAAPLIADLGRRMKTIYSDESAWTDVNLMASKGFSEDGVKATCTDYSEGRIKEYLLNGLPVIIAAQSKDPVDNSIIVGHGFIVDRYKRVKIRVETRYKWVYDDSAPLDPSIPIGITKDMPDRVEVSYIAPEIDMIGMNWGWEPQFNIDSEWYALTGDWIKDYYGVHNYNIKRHMIYINAINFN